MDSFNDNDVVITGVSGVFPKADNLEEFSEKLFAKENLLSSVPHMPCKLGKIKDLSKFDAEFFGFQPHRVNVMDPMARIILEKAYEAIIDSGNNPATFRGKSCGVFVGIHFLETEVLVYEKIQKGASLAISRSFNANRISYWLGVHGPSFTVDSACSSTLLALETAYKAIRDGECESALVGGCHVCLHPALLLHLLHVGALNPKGESRVFDENAGGFCKAEAIGMFYLQKAKNAKRIYARVINARSNHDGAKKLFLSPHGPSQAKLLKMVYEESKINLNDVQWIEAHSTGTLVGDKQEVTGIDEVFHSRDKPLLVGSVKSNMGHAEAAAGVGSISKVIIAMESGNIPPNINITNVRKDIEAFASGRMKVVTEKTPWNGGIVGVSGFGMGGANSHVVLESHRKKKINGGIPNDDLPRIVGVSGRTEEAVDALFDYLSETPLDAELVALLHEVYNYDIPLHPYRGYIILNKNGPIKRHVQNFSSNEKPSVWFAFADHLPNARNIYKTLKEINEFEMSTSKSAAILKTLGISDALDGNGVNEVLYSILIQIGLSDLLASVQIVPDNVVGYSLGQIVCAYIGASLTFEEAILTAFYCTKYLSKFNSTDVKTNENEWSELTSSLQKLFGSSLLSSKRIVTSLLESGNETSTIEEFIQSLPRSTISDFETQLNKIPNKSVLVDFLPHHLFLDTIANSLKGNSVVIRLTDDNGADFTRFVAGLGSLYVAGKNPFFSKLYPPVQFPVSRGTKMIAPLVKWKHAVKWPVAFSSFQERMLSGERKVSVCLDNKLDTYISGHGIDSSTLYPGTGYLVLVWETLALIYGKMYTDLSVVFENVRFHKAVIMPSKEPITFNIMVQKGNKYFEILENSQLVASGSVYVPKDVRKERVSISEPPADPVVLDGNDFYKYILIRNYNYKGEFRSIKEINSGGTKGRVSWTKNWVTYLDGMLQFNMLGEDEDNLCVPTEIEKIVIDVQEHEKFTKNNCTDLGVIMDKSLKLIESAGVQIKNCALRPIPCKLGRNPTVQKCTFVPYKIREKSTSLKNAVYLFAQCFMDNIGQLAKDVEAVEVVDDSSKSRALISASLLSFVNEQPQFQANVTVYTSGDRCQREIHGVNVVEGKLPLGKTVNLLTCYNVLQNEKKLENALNSLTENGFLIAREESEAEISIPSSLNLCGDVLFDGERVLLLRKKIRLVTSSFKVVKVYSDSFEWIEELKEALGSFSYDRIILVSEKQPLSGILGFVNCLRLERNTEKIRCYFIMDENAEPFSLENAFYLTQVLKDLAVNVYKPKEGWGCYVKLAVDRLHPVSVQHSFANLKVSGKRPQLQWCEGPIKTSQTSSKKHLIRVHYTAINSTDVLLFKNRLAVGAIVKNAFEEDYALGMEFSGRDSENRIRYLGLRNYGALSTLVQRNEGDLVNEVPKNWSLEDAVTVPIAYYTAVYGLVVCGKIKNKDRVLVHSAVSLIGQAALNIAIYYNCDIFVTVSSVEEKLFIKENFPYISESKIGYPDSSFEKMVHTETKGKGVNIILNSLPEDKFRTNVNCLARHGSFVQIKKLDLNNCNSYGNKLLSNNISLYSVTLEDLLNLPTDEKRELETVLGKHIENGSVRPLARTTYNYTGLESAFEFTSSAKGFGKCVVLIEPEEQQTSPLKNALASKEADPRFYCDPHKSYVVCGGLGGMGMEVVNWLVKRGAQKVVITSRSGVTKASQTLRINKWKSLGVTVSVSRADISNEKQTVQLLKDEAPSLGDVGGIFNLAAVLRDKMFKNQTVENFETCASSKLAGTRNLDRQSRILCPSLDQFVVFSSIASGHGNLGQTNYGFCNSSVERICELRKADNLPALAVEWGAVGNVGMFVSFMDGNTDSSYAGLYMQPMKSCLDVLDYSMNQSDPIVVSCVVAEKQQQRHQNSSR